MENSYLQHHGIKGMKWGVRRTEAQLARARGRKKNWSEDARTAHDIKKKSVNKMSNSELKKVNERVRLEQEYSRLNPNTVQKGWKFVVGTAAVAGTAVGLYNNSNQLVNIGKKFVRR